MIDPLTIQQVANLLGKSTSLIRRLIRQGRIQATAIGTGRRKIWQIERSELLRYKPKAVGRPRRVFLRPVNKTLAAYKRWILGMNHALGGKEPDTTTQAEWKHAHADFWNQAG